MPLLTREYVFWADCGGSTGTGGWSSWFGLTFTALHGPTGQLVMPEIGSWTRGTPPAALATKRFQRSGTVAGCATSEETTLKLWHTPLPAGG